MVKRDTYIDWLKGFAIFTVVLGHCWMRTNAMYWMIYRFHMVLFMTLSGYLFNGSRDFKTFVIRKAKSLMLPFLMYSLLSVVISMLFLGGGFRDIPSYLLGIIFGGRFCLAYNNFTLWYIPLMFIASVIMYFVVNKFSHRYNLIMWVSFLMTPPFYLLVRFVIFRSINIPFSIQVIPTALLCMMVGYKLKTENYNGSLVKNPYLNALLAIFMGLLGYVISIGSDATAIVPISYLFVSAALMICHMIVNLTKDCHNRIFCFVGENSLHILGVHRVILYILERRTGIGDWFIRRGITGGIASVLISVAVILFICACILVIRYLKDYLKNKNRSAVSPQPDKEVLS